MLFAILSPTNWTVDVGRTHAHITDEAARVLLINRHHHRRGSRHGLSDDQNRTVSIDPTLSEARFLTESACRMINTLYHYSSHRPLEQTARLRNWVDDTLIFATYCESDAHLRHACILVESIREFAGVYGRAPVRVYLPEMYEPTASSLVDRLHGQEVSIHTVAVPENMRRWPFAGKVCAAAIAEQQALGMARVLVWMDEDTVVLQPPTELALSGRQLLACRPVMHNRSGSAMSEPPDKFWTRVYELTELHEMQLFPMTTVADKVTIRPYFNAGLLAARPEIGFLRNWPAVFETLSEDSHLADLCRREAHWHLFLHQAALVGAILNLTDRHHLLELDDRYNYPLFFDRYRPASRQFNDLTEVVTLRYGDAFYKPNPEWTSEVAASTEILTWLAQRLGQ
jgi:hypothetical protein